MGEVFHFWKGALPYCESYSGKTTIDWIGGSKKAGPNPIEIIREIMESYKGQTFRGCHVLMGVLWDIWAMILYAITKTFLICRKMIWGFLKAVSCSRMRFLYMIM